MMRKLILVVVCFLLLVGVTWAGPFLVCDPQTGVLDYEVTIEQNGIPVVGGRVPAEADTTLRFDLEGIPNGTYVAKVKAGNLWGWSDWSLPFGFVVERCNPPTGVLIIP